MWTPAPPAALVGYGAAVWDVFPPAITRSIAKVDMAEVARLMWPKERSYDPTDLAASMGFSSAGYAIDHTSSTKLAQVVQAIAHLFSAVVTPGDPIKLLCAKVVTTDNAPKPTLASSLADLAGDERLEALVHLSALPMRPPCGVPAPWDDPWLWYSMGTEDLRWLLNAEEARN